jgi:D-alanyl-D-alanine carboxypeptidase
MSTCRNHRAKASALALLCLASCAAAGCEGSKGAIASALKASALPESEKSAIQKRIKENPSRFESLLESVLALRKSDPMLLYKVDKAKALPKGFVPAELTALDGSALSVSRAGHKLRRSAFQALLAMDKAARAQGITLLVSSSYRSFDYQVEVWNRTVAADGEAEAAASVAPPGHSQHQLGTAVDFGSITDAFAETKASAWLRSNAARFGFSLSFPKGLNGVTGYKWESWHYRYIGKEAAALEAEYFGGVQQYLLVFLEACE